MDIDDATGVWIQQQKRKSLKINKTNKTRNDHVICDTCKKVCNNQSQLNEHLKTHTQKNIFTCQKCNKNFKAQSILENHEKEHTKNSLYLCQECNEQFEEKSLLDNHLEKHEAVYKCVDCDKTFSNEKWREEHQKNHINKDNFNCESCGLIYTGQTELMSHKRTHIINNQEVELKCSKCEKVYPNMSKLRRHDWRSHRTVNCNICGLSLESREDISNHRKIEHNLFRKMKCRYFPNCIDENECFFEHEEQDSTQLEEKIGKSRYCLKGESCEDQSCEYSEVNHLNVKNVLCRFQAKCNKAECMFKHTMERASFLAVCTENSKKK